MYNRYLGTTRINHMHYACNIMIILNVIINYIMLYYNIIKLLLLVYKTYVVRMIS